MQRQETVEKLNFMAKWLENMHVTHPALKFNYGVLVSGDSTLNEGGHTCGTVGCAVGNMPWMWPREKSLATEPESGTLPAASREFLGIDYWEWDRLFQPGNWREDSGLDETANAVTVAAHIRRCAKAIGEGVDIASDEFREELNKLEDYAFIHEDYEFIDEDEVEDF